jgi:hypothetical protein
MIRKIRRKFDQIKDKKHHCFDDFDPIVRRCLSEYGHLFPNKQVNEGSGSKVVYHFNVEGVEAISLEREHGSREYLPRRFAKFAIAGIEDLLTFIEQAVGPEPDAEEGDIYAEGTDDPRDRADAEGDKETSERGGGQDAATPPGPKIPD